MDRLKEKFCAFDIVFQATIKRIRPDKGRKPTKNNVRITFERSDKERVKYYSCGKQTVLKWFGLF